ncbi:MAG: Glu-tRNA(Gln) amidotransferase subunit GatE, partial [Candidatus Woesearchaeota archaeon]|nr:Glu-tRNA(Gln) amidotransferase subunit GatE [Candidatus Woesearchaeota archaeon]
AGESGKVDSAAEYESRRDKEFLYHFYRDANCLVELDEEPPHPVNEDALRTALQIGLMLKAQFIDRIQFMRKTVVDGSNTSGFQRTALIAVNGFVELKGRKISIPTLCLEEEAAKIVERKDGQDVYNLSRLGIPLVEIATGAELNSPELVKECAETLGMILRSTGRIKRGLGTIRQDVNVSIREGERVEIKGAQDLRMLSRIVENEVIRQKNLVEIRRELENRGIKKIEHEEKDLTNALSGTKSKVLRAAIDNSGLIIGIRLSGLKGLLGREIQKGRRLGTEISEYAKKFGVSGIIHCDELPGYGITDEEIKIIISELKCSGNDGFAIIASGRENSRNAVQAAVKRARLSLSGVVPEVRKANEDGTSSFLRPMPGSSRMYPETDIPVIQSVIEGIEVPRLITERASDYVGLGLSEQMAGIVSRSNKREFFEKAVSHFKEIEPSFIASAIFLFPKDIESRLGLDSSKIGEDVILSVLDELEKGKISKQAVSEVFALVAKGENLNSALKKFESMDDSALEKEILSIISSLKSAAGKESELKENAVVGHVMDKLRGKADGKKIVELARKLMK